MLMSNKAEATEKLKKYIKSLDKSGDLKILSGECADEEPVGLLSGGNEDELELLRDMKQSDYWEFIKDENDK
jgi:hypothetical protein